MPPKPGVLCDRPRAQPLPWHNPRSGSACVRRIFSRATVRLHQHHTTASTSTHTLHSLKDSSDYMRHFHADLHCSLHALHAHMFVALSCTFDVGVYESLVAWGRPHVAVAACLRVYRYALRFWGSSPVDVPVTSRQPSLGFAVCAPQSSPFPFRRSIGMAPMHVSCADACCCEHCVTCAQSGRTRGT